MTYKSTLTSSLLALAIFLGCGISSCTYKKGSTTMAQQELNFKDFTAINANHGIELEITQGAEYSVSVSAPENYMDNLKIEQEGETLYVSLVNKGKRLLDTDDITVHITMPYISQIDLAGAAEACFLGRFETPQFIAHLSGSSNIEDLTVVADEVSIEATGASEVSGTVQATRAMVNLSGASDLDLLANQLSQMTMQLAGSSEAEIKGAVTNLQATLAGASEIDGEELTVSDLDIFLAGASSAEIRNSGNLRYKLAGASELTIYGSPKVLDSQSDRSSSIEIR